MSYPIIGYQEKTQQTIQRNEQENMSDMKENLSKSVEWS